MESTQPSSFTPGLDSAHFQWAFTPKMIRDTLEQSDHTSMLTFQSNRSLGVRSSNLSSTHLTDSIDEDEEKYRKANFFLVKRLQKYKKQHQGSRKPFFRRNARTTLDLSNLDLCVIPVDAVKLMAECDVERLCLSRNESMVVAPDTLVQRTDKLSTPLISLQYLDLSKCQIVILPEAWDLPNLSVLDLSHNRIRNFPALSVLKGIPSLQELNLYGNRLVDVPNFVGETSVSQHRHQAREPRKLASSPLSFNNEKRNSFRKSMSNRLNGLSPVYDSSLMTHLKKLNVGYNDLTYLPERLPISLQILIACNNIVSAVPAALLFTNALKKLDVSCNPISEPPLAICEAGLNAMKKYFATQESCQRFSQSASGDWKHQLQQHSQRQQARQQQEAGAPDGFPVSTRSRRSQRLGGSGVVVPEVVEFALSSRTNPFLAS